MAQTQSPPGALPDSLRQRLLALAEIGGNRLLGYDDDALAACAGLRGRCIAVRVTDLDLALYLHPGDWGIRLALTAPPRAADATIAGSLGALVSLAVADDKAAASIGERVSYSGDIALAQRLQAIVTALDIDWEEMLARHGGDIAAYQVGRGLRGIHRFLVAGAESLLQSGGEYLREEARLTPTRPEFERFRARLAELRNDVARAEARVDRLLAGRRGR